MSQAEELLNSLSEEAIEARSDETYVEPHIVIGRDRVVLVPKELKRLGVQYDHDIETVTFDCPRYWDGHDMSKMSVYINYKRPDKKTGTYPARNVVVDEIDDTIMHFDWTISKNVTLVKGPLVFLVCVRKADDEGYEENHWNSELCMDAYISEGLEHDGEAILVEYPDYLVGVEREFKESFDALKSELIAAKDAGEFDGEDGISPTIAVVDIEGGHAIYITDANGQKSFNVLDGKKGDDATSPTMSITNINGGHRVTIVDVNGTRYFDVMDGTTEISEAVVDYLDKFVYIGGVEPISGPVLWFDTSVDTNGQSSLMKYKDADGALHIIYPIISKDNIAGMEDLDAHMTDTTNPHKVTIEQIGAAAADHVQAINAGGTGATDAATARSNLGVYSINEVDTAISRAIGMALEASY